MLQLVKGLWAQSFLPITSSPYGRCTCDQALCRLQVVAHFVSGEQIQNASDPSDHTRQGAMMHSPTEVTETRWTCFQAAWLHCAHHGSHLGMAWYRDKGRHNCFQRPSSMISSSNSF